MAEEQRVADLLARVDDERALIDQLRGEHAKELADLQQTISDQRVTIEDLRARAHALKAPQLAELAAG